MDDNVQATHLLIQDMEIQGVLLDEFALAATAGMECEESHLALWRPTGGILTKTSEHVWWTDARSPTATRLSNAVKCLKGLWQDSGYNFHLARHDEFWVANGQNKFYVRKKLVRGPYKEHITGGYGRVSKSKYEP